MKKKSNSTILLFFFLSLFIGTTNFLSSLAVVLIWLFTAIMILGIYGPSIFKRKSFVLFLCFYIVVAVYAFFGHGSVASFEGHVAHFLGTFSILIFSVYLTDLSNRELKKTLYVLLFSLFISVLGTTYVSIYDVLALRIYGAGGGEELIGYKYRLWGMMSYSQAHALAVLIPPLVMFVLFVDKMLMKILGIILFLLIFRILFVMQITAALITSVATSLLLVVYLKNRGSWKKTAYYSVFVLVIFIYSGLFSFVLERIESYEDIDAANKMASIANMQGGEAEGDVGVRMELYSNSLQTFLSNPIFGWGVDDGSRKVIGKHSFLFDFLALYGIFAFLLFVAWIKEYQSLCRFLYGKIKTYYLFCLVPLFIMLATKSMFAYTSYLFTTLIIIRILFLYIVNLKTTNKNCTI